MGTAAANHLVSFSGFAPGISVSQFLLLKLNETMREGKVSGVRCSGKYDGMRLPTDFRIVKYSILKNF